MSWLPTYIAMHVNTCRLSFLLFYGYHTLFLHYDADYQ